MRVVAGEAKGRRLKSPRTPGTRPIIDRVKTALFDILATRLEGARFLDLFAGTGSVGIEALSRGAAFATFIEIDPRVLKVLRENLQLTGLLERAETLRADAFKWLMAQAQQESRPGVSSATVPPSVRAAYDIIYVAPPQYHQLAARALALLDRSPLLSESGLVIVQIHPRERDELLAVPLTRLTVEDERRYGSTLLLFYAVKKELTGYDTQAGEA
ncbi:16S rRNA (guanine(966)-N(2))-methyltransferase RsmD [Thermogemmatispora sp.]|uniref:16S rRNA (guanine(966)-N(2))-methyltransferase RsmD n=1 Tax=Thermogemmatispora sp. TaxID=1968838 RepID=UPI001DD994F3|nr:16S rRNA (guanine(966)-N(2))-methyltransferase RsmD [Thermogemmatispora sp.]MBX5448588.1 16S rRNA (guanine(966)-N(2))-methyltransferase RsmD [Thermogemmatispora sp.]